ncbi:MAG: sigma-70 family RNA polymerase sigma factor [Tepidisphaeraceae bacterium]
MSWVPRLFGSGSVSDEQSMRLVQATGDAAAFARLVDRWEGPIRRLCVRMSGDEHRGEDLAQEAFARVFANRERFDQSRKFSTWLWRIALNLCHEHARRSGRRGERSLDEQGADHPAASDAEDGPHVRAVRSERAELVRGALEQLPESHRAVVVLREYENLKFREIAEVLDVPEGTVKWRMSEALDQLGEYLKPILAGDEDMPPAGEPGAAKERLAL